MAGLNVSKWQAARRKTFYDPAMQFFLRLVRTALDEARAVKGLPCPTLPEGYGVWWGAHADVWDRAIMARDWIARETPDRHADECGYLLSFQHCCEVLGLDADREGTWMLREIDGCADFDTDGVHARVQFLIDNPPDEVEEELFEGFRVVPSVDQGCMFGEVAA
jgi:hypothetical protein